jgi:Uma2 family endonuclease
MGMATASKGWTREEVLALQEAARPGVRYELIDGELLVSPSPTSPHQLVVDAFMFRLYGYCRQHGLGRAVTSPADLSLDGGSIMQPDVFVVPTGTRFRWEGWDTVTRLLLAVNVLSPSTARGDRTVKRAFLQRNRVPEYWIVDHHARLVERWRPEDERPEIVTGTLTWQPVATIEPLVIALPELFSEALRDVEGDPDEDR